MNKRILFSSIIAGLLLASCGIMKNDDFASRKYTHFKKGESTVAIVQNKSEKETVANDQNSIQPNGIADNDNSAQTISMNDNTQTYSKSNNANTTDPGMLALENSSKKEKFKRTANLIKDRLVNKANTTANGAEHSLLWTIIVILLILWLIGLLIDIGPLINLLVVIALILLILYLLGMANF